MNNIISIILIVASAGIFFTYTNPTYGALTGSVDIHEKSIRELKTERAEYTDALNKTKEIEQARTGLLEKYNGIPIADREQLEKLLPDHIDSVRLIIDVNNIASQYRMSLKNISLSQSGNAAGGVAGGPASGPPGFTIGPSSERFKTTGLQFSVSGTYEDFRSFIQDLEHSLRLADIESIAFSASEEGEYDYSISISTYRLNMEDNESL